MFNDSNANFLDFSGPGQRDLRLPNFKLSDYPETYETKSNEIRVYDTYTNLKFLLSKFAAVIRYNLMKREPEIEFPGFYCPIEDQANYILGLVKKMATLNGMPKKDIDHHLDMIALENIYHPVVKCIIDKPWDGISRIKEFIGTLETNNPEFTYQIVLTWMVSAIAAAHSNKGFVNQGVLVLQGEQNIGKTTWIKNLDPINCESIKIGMFLDPTNKDSVSQIAKYWIVELGELDSIFGKVAISRLKSYITLEYDLLRTPYARKPISLARRTAYAATINEKNYLIDDTGNRRWWTISVNKIHHHHFDMQQVWAEVYDIWQKGHLTYLDHELLNKLNKTNKTHEKIDPIEEKLLTEYDWSNPARRWLTATAIAEEMNIPIKHGEVTKIGTTLRKLKLGTSKRSHGVTTHEIPLFKIYIRNGAAY